MKRRLTEEEKNGIKKLLAEGRTTVYIAGVFGISQTCVQYWKNAREKTIKRNVEAFRKKSSNEKKKFYNKWKGYYKIYFKKRYWNDPIFREKIQRWNRENKRAKKEVIQI